MPFHQSRSCMNEKKRKKKERPSTLEERDGVRSC
jgi:hypothetical protein